VDKAVHGERGGGLIVVLKRETQALAMQGLVNRPLSTVNLQPST
jgi:hypothetical protein